MFKMKNQTDIYKCIEDLSKGQRNPSDIIKNIEYCLKATKDWNEVLEQANERKGRETWLHTALMHLNFRSNEEKKVIKQLIKKFPKLILQDRHGTNYAGQTPLHMGVCKGNVWSVKYMLEFLSKTDNKHWKRAVLRRMATGSIFNNTVMMAELPLFIAALTFNKEMFDLLLKHEAELDAINRDRNTVCHSLIRYAYHYPDKLDDVLDMLKYIKEDPTPSSILKEDIQNRKLRKKIWLMENKDLLNPLQYAAKYGQHQIFELIMNMEAYCFENTKDGLFDIKIYDITEIDPIASMSREELTGVDQKKPNDSQDLVNISPKELETGPTLQRTSIIMTLLDLDPKCAFQFIMFPAVRMVIDKKWEHYKCKYFYPWWILHFLIMCFLTWYGVEKAQQSNNSVVDSSTNTVMYNHGSPDFTNRIPSDAFVTSYGVISVLVGVLYIVQEVTRFVQGRMRYTMRSFTNPYSNGTFRLIFLGFALALILDFCVSWAPKYENYLLIMAIWLGWFLIIFFLRGMRPFSYFTVLIQRVLVGDMFRFFVILAIELIAFSTAMYMVIQGSDLTNEPEFSDFGRIFFAMLKLMVGMGEIDSIYSVRHPPLAIIIFVAFIIMTTLLMMNALIAMMSRTCSDLVENIPGISINDMHWKLQRLSLVLFIESILPSCLIWRSGEKQDVHRYDNMIHRRKEVKRYMLEVRSLQKDNGTGPPPFESSWGWQTAVVNVLGQMNGNKMEKKAKKPPPNVSAAPVNSEMTPVNDVSWNDLTTAPPPKSHLSKSMPINQHAPQKENRKVLDIYHVELKRGRHDSV